MAIEWEIDLKKILRKLSDIETDTERGGALLASKPAIGCANAESFRAIAEQLDRLNGNIELVMRNDGIGDGEGNFWIRTGA